MSFCQNIRKHRIRFDFGVNDNGCKRVFSSCNHGPNDKCSLGKVVARMSGQDGLVLSEEQLWAAFRDAHKCFQVDICQIFQSVKTSSQLS